MRGAAWLLLAAVVVLAALAALSAGITVDCSSPRTSDPCSTSPPE